MRGEERGGKGGEGSGHGRAERSSASLNGDTRAQGEGAKPPLLAYWTQGCRGNFPDP